MAPKNVVDFSKPLPRRMNQTHNWDAVAEGLRSTPNEWGVVAEVIKSSTVNAIRQGSVRALAPELGFEIRTRNNVREPERTCQLWMRYNPSKDDQVRSAIRRSRG